MKLLHSTVVLVWHLQRVLNKKRDPLTLASFVEVVQVLCLTSDCIRICERGGSTEQQLLAIFDWCCAWASVRVETAFVVRPVVPREFCSALGCNTVCSSLFSTVSTDGGK